MLFDQDGGVVHHAAVFVFGVVSLGSSRALLV
jgi:hypothetical protein